MYHSVLAHSFLEVSELSLDGHSVFLQFTPDSKVRDFLFSDHSVVVASLLGVFKNVDSACQS